ncbi:MAG TPA: CBS domain-containing protein [Solirubrobacteraceae bacterium]|nr:CBS domain-containing protein [Solirubrobacteraceae bacterium]HUA71414.1 CBS domain-containing protein [Solirubrobacteraceae bacterium]
MPDTTIQTIHGSYLMPSLNNATVGDAMHPGILSCDGDASLTEVARLMATHHVHCIAVMAPSHGVDGGELVWGLIFDFDLVEAGMRGSEQTARELANEPVMGIRPTVPLRQACEKMLEEAVSHMIVIDPETRRPIGVLSTLDIIGTLAWGEA